MLFQEFNEANKNHYIFSILSNLVVKFILCKLCMIKKGFHLLFFRIFKLILLYLINLLVSFILALCNCIIFCNYYHLFINLPFFIKVVAFKYLLVILFILRLKFAFLLVRSQTFNHHSLFRNFIQSFNDKKYN